MSAWTPELDDVIRRLYPTAARADVLSALPGKTWGAVHRRAWRLRVGREVRESVANPGQFGADHIITESMREWSRSGNARRGKFKHPVVVVDGVDGKVCSACASWKSLEKFARQADCSGGRRAICTTCEGRKAYAGNREARIAAVRRYQQAYPEKRRLHKQAGDRMRHGRKMEGPGVSTQQIRELLTTWSGFCAYCRRGAADTIDHVMPLSRGGEHGLENLLPACSACNFSKHDKTLEEWLAA